jgi:hypothetical protein
VRRDGVVAVANNAVQLTLDGIFFVAVMPRRVYHFGKN